MTDERHLKQLTAKDLAAVTGAVAASLLTYEIVGRSTYMIEHFGGKESLFGQLVAIVKKVGK